MRNNKRATCFATLRQDELNNDVARFTTHIKPVLQQIRLLTGLMWVVKRATSIFNSFCSNVAKQVARFLLPVFPYFNKFNGANCNSCYVGETRRHFHTSELINLQTCLNINRVRSCGLFFLESLYSINSNFTNMSRKALFLYIMFMCDENIINLSASYIEIF